MLRPYKELLKVKFVGKCHICGRKLYTTDKFTRMEKDGVKVMVCTCAAGMDDKP